MSDRPHRYVSSDEDSGRWIGFPFRQGDIVISTRYPLDMAVSLYHQGLNIDRERVRELTGADEPDAHESTERPLREWLQSWATSEADPRESMDSLPGVMWHLADGLDTTVPDGVWPDLVEAATFESMKSRAQQLLPNRNRVFKDIGAFFRRGRSGAGREVLSAAEIAAYRARAADLAPSDLLAWLHRD